ncbi:putative cytochrome P450 6a23 [Eufriesea mexicana]|uniref:Putative cytochrome P450 6a23 n=1 Tax=Eufriesea mexicana TaxID=516756 RepID=A0A310SNZ0_9HYME|nr:putative cytochrome P450 6a23 [Eufriesea mexicana]
MFLATWLLSDILATVVLVGAGLYLYYKLYVYKFWSKRRVFYIEPTFPVGNIMPIITGKTSLAEFFRDKYEQNKQHRLVGIYMLHKPFLLVNDPDLIRDVLTKEFSNFHDRGIFCNKETDPLSGNLFQLPGKKWRHLRVKLTPTFTSGKIKQIFPILTETGNMMEKFFNDKAQTRSTVDVKDIFSRYSVDIIMSAAFGITCNSFENPNNEFMYWGKKIFDPKPFWNALILWAPQVFDMFSLSYNEKDVTNFFTNMFKETVEYRQSPSKLLMSEAAAQAYVFYLAGFETSSTTATFCLYELAKDQDIQNKVRDEIRTQIKKHGELSYAAVQDMEYLHKVISETLRKYPPVVILNRVCTKETQLKTTNFSIPVGTSLAIPVFGIHRDPDVYPEPNKFDPERFSEENIKARHPYNYLPFGEGPRICIGLRFGLIQTKVAVINALLNNKFKLAPDTPTSLEFEGGTLILMAKGGVQLTIEPLGC